jgi:cytoskeleton protein RodZ
VAEKKTIQSDVASEFAAGAEPGDLSVGKLLIEARTSKGLSCEEALSQAHIPVHYGRMIEGDDYSRISDQLYLIPWVRKYAAFLGLDSEEVAMQFIRAIQSNDATVARMAEPIAMGKREKRRWTKAIITLAIVLLLGGYFVIHYLRSELVTSTKTGAEQGEPSLPMAQSAAPALASDSPTNGADVPKPPAAPAAPAGAAPMVNRPLPMQLP